MLAGININANNPNIVVDGGYIEHPTCSNVVATGVNNDNATGLIVDGLDVNGTNNGAGRNIKIAAGGIAQNCNANQIYIGGVDSTNLFGNSPYP